MMKEKKGSKQNIDEGKEKEVNRDIICEELDLYLLIHQEILDHNSGGSNFRHGGRRRRFLDA